MWLTYVAAAARASSHCSLHDRLLPARRFLGHGEHPCSARRSLTPHSHPRPRPPTSAYKRGPNPGLGRAPTRHRSRSLLPLSGVPTSPPIRHPLRLMELRAVLGRPRAGTFSRHKNLWCLAPSVGRLDSNRIGAPC